MELRQAVRIWRARWIFTSVLVILAVVGAAEAVAKMPRYYQSASSVVLLASHAASKQNGGNPFLSFGPSLTLTADAVSRELTAPATVSQLAARGFTASYTVAVPPVTTFTTGSVLLATVAGTDAAGVQRTLQAVTKQISTQLAQLQRGVPAPSRVRADTLSFSPRATLSISQTARPLVIVGALLLVICLGTPIVVDGLVTRRRLRTRPTLPDSPALPQDWALLDIPDFPQRPALPEEPAVPEAQTFQQGAMRRADPQAGDDPAAVPARHARHPRPAGRRTGPGTSAVP
jgi:hypothetical protein